LLALPLALVVLILAGCARAPNDRHASRAQATSPPSPPSPAAAPTTPSEPEPVVGAKYLDLVETETGLCVLYADGRVACWKSPMGTAIPRPDLVRDVTTAVAITRDDHHVAITLANGRVWEQPVSYGATPGWMPISGHVVAVADRCGRRDDGSVECYCAGSVGVPPVPLVATDLAEGGNTYCVVTTGGDVECWGQHIGILGPNRSNSPVTGLEHVCPNERGTFRFGDASGIAVGNSHACVLKTSGAVACWGWRDDNLGGGVPTSEGMPVAVAIPPARSIRAHFDATCAVTRDLSAYCWGSFQYPTLAKGMPSLKRTPVRLPLEGVTAVSPEVSCAIVDRGQRVTCWAIREGCRDSDCFQTYDVPMP
jgi:Regulator of Chromosome Condensation (RCC1) repeat protein